MSLRCVLLSLLLVSFTIAADQTSTPANPIPSPTPPANRPTSQHPTIPKLPRRRIRTASDGSQGLASPHPLRRPMVGAGYSYFSGGYPYGYGPEYWAYSPYYLYNPVLWSPFYHPGYYTGFAYRPNMGKVKIQAPDKTSMVYLDGALAGRLDRLKDMWLEPGAYQLEVRSRPAVDTEDLRPQRQNTEGISRYDGQRGAAMKRVALFCLAAGLLLAGDRDGIRPRATARITPATRREKGVSARLRCPGTGSQAVCHGSESRRVRGGRSGGISRGDGGGQCP